MTLMRFIRCPRCGKPTHPNSIDKDTGVCENCLGEILSSTTLRKMYNIDPPEDDSALWEAYKQWANERPDSRYGSLHYETFSSGFNAGRDAHADLIEALKASITALSSTDDVQMYGPADKVRERINTALRLAHDALAKRRIK